MGRDYAQNPVAAILKVDGVWFGKIGYFLTWREALVEMTGSRLRTVLRDRLLPPSSRFGAVETVGLWEIERTDLDWGPALTPERRRGIWAKTPEEPLWVLLYLTVPGGVLQARHAAAIAQRLDELDEVVYAVNGMGTRNWRDFFWQQAKTGQDVTCTAEFESVGWIDFDLAQVDPG